VPFVLAAGKASPMTKSKRGGKRKGAGSKPKPIEQTKPIQKGFRCSVQVGAFLAEVGTGFIEDAIRVSEAFKRWSKGK
jgi:hypothetical protein